MPRINLLPIKAAKQQISARNELFTMVGLVVAALVVLFFWYTSVESEISDLRARLQGINTDIQQLTQEVKKVESLQDKEKTVKKKLGIIKKLVADRAGPARMLNEVAVIMTNEAKRVWLVSLNHKDTGEVVMSGGAIDHEDISELQLALERRDEFSNVVLKHVTTTKTTKKDEVPHLLWELSAVWNFKGTG